MATELDVAGLAYVHDPAGGIVQRTLSDPDDGWAPVTGATTYANDGLNRVTAVGGAATTYDSRKNLTQAPGTPTTVYDALNQLWYAATTRIWYEPLGRLYLTYDYGNTADHRYHAYDGQRRVTDYDGATDALLRRHVPGAGLDDVVATVAADGARTWLTGDERGSVMALSNGSGAVTQVNAWDEYGVPRPSNAGTFQYTGQVWLGFAGMQHSRARTYDPSLGRFRQTDPIGYAAGANLYAYVGADPVNRVDPLGLYCIVKRYYTDTYEGVRNDAGEIVGWRLIGTTLDRAELICPGDDGFVLAGLRQLVSEFFGRGGVQESVTATYCSLPPLGASWSIRSYNGFGGGVVGEFAFDPQSGRLGGSGGIDVGIGYGGSASWSSGTSVTAGRNVPDGFAASLGVNANARLGPLAFGAGQTLAGPDGFGFNGVSAGVRPGGTGATINANVGVRGGYGGQVASGCRGRS